MDEVEQDLYDLFNISKNSPRLDNVRVSYFCAVLLLGGLGVYAIDKQSEYFEQEIAVKEAQKQKASELELKVDENNLEQK